MWNTLQNIGCRRCSLVMEAFSLNNPIPLINTWLNSDSMFQVALEEWINLLNLVDSDSNYSNWRSSCWCSLTLCHRQALGFHSSKWTLLEGLSGAGHNVPSVVRSGFYGTVQRLRNILGEIEYITDPLLPMAIGPEQRYYLLL